MRAKCAFCLAVCDDVRMRTDGGAYGPVDTPTCKPCHEKENASARAEGKRFGYRPRGLKRWEQLTVKGAFCQVQPAE